MKRILIFAILLLCIHDLYAQTIRDTVFNDVILIKNTDVVTYDGVHFFVDIPIAVQKEPIVIFNDNNLIPLKFFFDNDYFLSGQNEIILIMRDAKYYEDIAKEQKEKGIHIKPCVQNKIYHIKRYNSGYEVDSLSVRMDNPSRIVKLNFRPTQSGNTLNNPFENIIWNADEIIGLKDFKFNNQINVISFAKVDSTRHYGNITEFKNNEFTAYSTGFCGNGCYPTTIGTYKVNGNKIDLFVNTIAFGGACSGVRDTVVNQSLGTFYWVKNEYGLRFLKDRSDAHKLDYLAYIQRYMPPFKFITSSQIISRFISVYDRYIKIVPNPDNKEYTALANVLQTCILQADNWESEAEKHKITNEAEYLAYKKIMTHLRSILSDTQKRRFIE